MAVGVLAGKDLRLLLRDRRAAIVLLGMPVLFILLLGMLLGEGFGQKPDDRLRVSVVIEDRGPAAGDEPPVDGPGPAPRDWSTVVLRDLEQTAGIRVEIIRDRDAARRLVGRGDRSAVLVFGPEFSRRVGQCSFLDDRVLKKPGLNPFFREGIDLKSLDLEVLRDPTQDAAAAIIEQGAQVTLLRVVMPWMIGRAFEEVGRQLPIAIPVLNRLFSKYDLTAKSWSRLTRSQPLTAVRDSNATVYEEPTGGLVQRGAVRYQILVPSLTVTFAFFLVLSAGWLFVAERRQGTLLRLRVSPLTRGEILLGKILPCLAVSLIQGFSLLAAGRLAFGMSLGSQPLWLIPVVVATSLAATGIAILVGGAARTESQVAVFGTLLVLVLAGLGGCLMPRALMPEAMRSWSKLTPHAWALDAYSQLLLNPHPEIEIVLKSCLVLVGFATAFLLMAWVRMRLD
ncbi:MAG: ABC transporter permease [Gemmataceae bacterium]|nr:ABC transporter permease [Gemmataceae bacterium]